MALDAAFLRMLARIERLERVSERRQGIEVADGIAASTRVYNSAAVSVANATFQALLLNTERFDTVGSHELVVDNTKLTCAVAGRYWIHGQIAYDPHATGERAAGIRLNGTTFIAFVRRLSSGAGIETVMTANTFWSLAVGDYVQLIAYQTSGAALNAAADASYSPEFMWFRAGP